MRTVKRHRSLMIHLGCEAQRSKKDSNSLEDVAAVAAGKVVTGAGTIVQVCTVLSFSASVPGLNVIRVQTDDPELN